uniref:Ulp1 protease family, C-terminal catalytic domain-containing protein n=1 Tax=Tanacetum cinerariifolium TaxID=118510 RepID=A0A699H2N6_TANCI|nr:hypothetical protein [Tanacetum cinerariifolium]
MFGVNDLTREEVVTIDIDKVSAAPTTDVTEDEITMAQALAALKSVKPTIPADATKVTTVVPTPRAKGIVFQEQKQSHIPIVSSSKDKGKAKMIEPEVPIKKKDQIRMDEEYAKHLEAEEKEVARLSRAQQDEEANISWDNTQAMMEADSLFAERLQAREREDISKVQKARMLVKLIEKRKKHFAALRAQEKRNKPPTKAQIKGQMCTYLINIGGYKHSHLNGRSYDDIKKLFDREMKKVNHFIAMDSEAQKSSRKEAQESSTKRIAKSLESDISKKQKVDENVELDIDDTGELKKCMEIVPDEEDEVLIKATPISSRSPTIINYKIHKEGKKNYFKIIRADVKDRFKKEKPVEDMDNLLLRTLKTMFEHHVEDTIWTYQQGLAKVKNWKLFESCGVYCIIMQSIIYYLLVEKGRIVRIKGLQGVTAVQEPLDLGRVKMKWWRKKVNSGYVVDNVLMGCGGAYVGNNGNKKYNKYKKGTLCKGMSLLILFEMEGEDEMVKSKLDKLSGKIKGEEKRVRKKVNNGHVMENVLMVFREAYVRNEGKKMYNKYKEEEFRLEKGFKDEKYEGDDV